MEEGEENSKVVWNFDDAESKLIFQMKEVFVFYRDKWDLENAYWTLLSLFSEIKPLYDDTVRKELDEEFNKITQLRNDTNKFSNLEENDKGACFIQLNNFYIRLCNEMVTQDYYFRKKKEYLGL